MLYKIKNKKYINEISILKEAIKYPPLLDNSVDIFIDIIKGEQNKNKIIESKTNFSCIHRFLPNPFGSKYLYFILKNELGSYIVREDNILQEKESKDTLKKLNIKSLINNGDLTILITMDGDKYFTKRNELDEFDLEKAVMVLLIKAKIYATPKQISDLVKCVKIESK